MVPDIRSPVRDKPHLRDPLQKRMNEYSHEEVSRQIQTGMLNKTNDLDFPTTPCTLAQGRNGGGGGERAYLTAKQTEGSRQCALTGESMSL